MSLRVRQMERLRRMQMVVVVVEVYCTTASARTAGDGGGGGEQTGPGVEGARELHAAGVVAWKGAISPSSSFPYALDGLCKGHISSRLVRVTIRCEAECRPGTGGSRGTSARIERAAKTSR